jgi:hypothetical protein
MAKIYIDTCCVADQFCTAPANLEPQTYPRSTCYSCGQAVCLHCSSKRIYFNFGKVRKVRLCNNCQVDHDGNEKKVMDRMSALARC